MVLTPETFRRLCAARRLLGDASNEALPVSEIARRVGLSRYHFIRQFHGTFGATPQQWRTAARLDRAKRLLAAGRSVTDVCFDVGFTSLGTFSQLFSRRIGQSPSRFRRRFGAGTAADAMIPGCLTLMGALPAGDRNSEEASVSRAGSDSADAGGSACASN